MAERGVILTADSLSGYHNRKAKINTRVDKGNRVVPVFFKQTSKKKGKA